MLIVHVLPNSCYNLFSFNFTILKINTKYICNISKSVYLFTYLFHPPQQQKEILELHSILVSVQMKHTEKLEQAFRVFLKLRILFVGGNLADGISSLSIDNDIVNVQQDNSIPIFHYVRILPNEIPVHKQRIRNIFDLKYFCKINLSFHLFR